MDNKYKNGKIYTIRNKNDNTLIYVGSTIGPLYKRFSQHKIDSKKPENKNRQIYIKMNETNFNDFNDWYIELYEDFPCDRKEQLTRREGQVIRDIGTLNKIISGRTKKEYGEDKKEIIKAHENEHVFCDCGCSIVRHHIARHKRSPKHQNIMNNLMKA